VNDYGVAARRALIMVVWVRMPTVTLLEDTTELQERDAKGALLRQYTVQSGKKILVGATKEALVALIMTDTGAGTPPDLVYGCVCVCML
jgi:hypothetical protein